MHLTTNILIRTKNEANAIAKTLALVTDQSLPPDEITVVDSGSTDGTVELVRQWPQVNLIQIRPETFTFGRSLNIGFAATQADLVLTLSAHAFPCDRDWIKQLVSHFADPQVAGVYGKQLPHPDAYPSVEREYRDFYDDQQRRQTNPDERRDRTFSNANAAIRRHCWERRPFDETLSGCEDVEWAWSMLTLGYSLIYEPAAGVLHSHNESFPQVYRRSYREAAALQALYKYDMGLRGAWRTWTDATLRDLRFVRQHCKAPKWLLHAPIYRLFWTYGHLRPSLPDALWKPISKCWRRYRMPQDRGVSL